jgi:hypothetical protein
VKRFLPAVFFAACATTTVVATPLRILWADGERSVPRFVPAAEIARVPAAAADVETFRRSWRERYSGAFEVAPRCAKQPIGGAWAVDAFATKPVIAIVEVTETAAGWNLERDLVTTLIGARVVESLRGAVAEVTFEHRAGMMELDGAELCSEAYEDVPLRHERVLVGGHPDPVNEGHLNATVIGRVSGDEVRFEDGSAVSLAAIRESIEQVKK